MTHSTKSNNDLLRDLVETTGLSAAVAMTIFNRGLGTAACPESTWKAFLCAPDSVRHKPLSDALLAHARQQFARLSHAA
jgi:hypothetical protein